MAKSIYYLYYLVEQIMSYLCKGENITGKLQGGKFLHPSPLYYGWGMSLLVRQLLPSLYQAYFKTKRKCC